MTDKGKITKNIIIFGDFSEIEASGKDGATLIRKHVEVPKRIKSWWFQSKLGKVCVSIRYGAQLI